MEDNTRTNRVITITEERRSLWLFGGDVSEKKSAEMLLSHERRTLPFVHLGRRERES